MLSALRRSAARCRSLAVLSRPGSHFLTGAQRTLLGSSAVSRCGSALLTYGPSRSFAAESASASQKYIPPFARSVTPLPARAPPTADLAPNTSPSELPGLIGIPGLHTPDQIVQNAKTAIATASAVRDSLAHPHDFRTTLQKIDDMSNVLCAVVDVAEFIRNHHEDSRWRASANEAWFTLQEALTEFSLDRTVVDALERIYAESWGEPLTEEQRRFVVSMLATLPEELDDDAVARTSALSSEATHIEGIAGRGMSSAAINANAITVPVDEVTAENYPSLADNADAPVRFPRDRRAPGDVTVRPGFIARAVAAMEHRPSRRALLSVTAGTNGYDNVPALSALVAARHAVSSFSGATSFAEFSARGHVTRTPDLTASVLFSVRDKIMPLVEEEMSELVKVGVFDNQFKVNKAAATTVSAAVLPATVRPSLLRGVAAPGTSKEARGVLGLVYQDDPADWAPLPVRVRGPVLARSRRATAAVAEHAAAAEAEAQAAGTGAVGRIGSAFKSMFGGGGGSGSKAGAKAGASKAQQTADLSPAQAAARHTEVCAAAASALRVPTGDGARAAYGTSTGGDPRQWLLQGRARAQSAQQSIAAHGPLKEHDMPFLRDTMVLAAGGGNAREEELAAYLSLPNVINGLDLWAHSLFDVRLIPVPLRADEGWAGAGSHGNRSAGRQGRASAGTDKGSTLVKLLAVDYSAGRNAAANGSFDARAHAAAIGDGELLGVVYLDLFYRQDKHSSAATFTIQCGRVAHDPTSPATAGAVDVTDLYPTLRGTGLGNGTASSSAAATGAAAAAAGGRYQMPVAVVSMSCRTVNPPAAAVTAGGVAPVLIHPDHLETIFHEMGHAMHSMLGRTQYQHLAGSRGELDYVEMPSTFAEFFANDPRVVSQYARAFDTDAPLSPQSPLLEFRQLRQNLFAGVDTLNEVFNGLLDQRFYGAPAAFDAHRVFPQYEVVTAADALKNALVTNNAGKTAAAAARVPAPAAGESCVLSDADAVAVAESHGFWLEPALETAEALAQAFPTTAAEAAKHAHAHPAQMFLLAHQVRAAVHPVALPVGAIPYATFSHYIAYGGTYYTYIFCRLFAWALWNKHFQAKPLNRAGGRKLRRALAAGGARQPMDLLVELLETPEAGPGAGAPVFPVTVRPRNPATGETCEPATLRPPWVPAAGRRDHLYMPFGPRHLRALTEALELFSNQVVAQGRDAIELWRKLEEKHNR